jgi:hypothetical protein
MENKDFDLEKQYVSKQAKRRIEIAIKELTATEFQTFE